MGWLIMFAVMIGLGFFADGINGVKVMTGFALVLFFATAGGGPSGSGSGIDLDDL